MMVSAVGCSFRTAPIEVRERLAFTETSAAQALEHLTAAFGLEAVLLSTCNRVELYAATSSDRPAPDAGFVAEWMGKWHGMDRDRLLPYLYERRGAEAVRHLFRVAASLDSMVVGEGQIAGQVKAAYELAVRCAVAGPVVHALFQHARRVAGRVRSSTGIAQGHVSVASLAVDYVRQVFAHFDDKYVLVMGAGKMSELTLRHLGELRPRGIWITNRSPEKAKELAGACAGKALPWEKLDDLVAGADIVLSATGAPEPVMTRERFEKIRARRQGGPLVVLDIAIPRDFDPNIHDGEHTCVFNIDDLKRARDATLHERLQHVAPAEAIVDEEVQRFLREWQRHRHGPVIARLTREFEAKREAVEKELMRHLNGRLTDDDRAHIHGAFRILQNHFLHGPISALGEEHPESGGHTLLEALRKLFRLHE
jgi:glutamyl-tRNA reductase